MTNLNQILPRGATMHVSDIQYMYMWVTCCNHRQTIDEGYHSLTGYFPTKNMQTPPPYPLSFDLVLMDGAQCAKTNGKSISRFLFFEPSWEIHRKFGYKNDHKSKNKKSENWLLIRFRTCEPDRRPFGSKSIGKW